MMTIPNTPQRSAPHADPAEVSAGFRAAFRAHPGGVAVITADGGDGPVGLTATSVCSVSVDPPAVAFSLSAVSSAAPAIRRARTVVVHLLDADQLELAKTFSTSGIDRFADTSTWDRLPTGEPYLPSAAAWMRGEITGTLDVGGSAVTAVRVLEVRLREDEHAAPLVYCNRTWHRLGGGSVVA
ncbi:flavin reductase family protein [Kocuria flava]|uniref:flavin reductase family protein n=1 Tax=Kocuria flava TaxID=446860 RepID=UPI002F938FB0